MGGFWSGYTAEGHASACLNLIAIENAVGEGITHGVRADRGVETAELFGLCRRLADCIFLLGELHACGLQLVLDLSLIHI